MKFIIMKNFYKKLLFFSFERKIINYLCEGWSNWRHWKFFQEVFSRKKKFKNIGLLGVYRGRDLGYMCSALKKNNGKDFHIYAIDLFDFKTPFRKVGNKKIWQQDPNCLEPSIESSKRIVKILGCIKNVTFIKDDFLKIEKLKTKLDFVYIDIAHDYKTTSQAIDICRKLGGKNILFTGDDFYNGYTLNTPWGVKKAVKKKFSNFKVHYGYIWESSKKYYKKI